MNITFVIRPSPCLGMKIEPRQVEVSRAAAELRKGTDVATPITIFISLLTALAAGCTSQTGDGSPAGADGGGGGPLFLVQSRIFPPQGTIGLLTPTASLDRELDYSRSIEQPGGGVLYAEPGVGTFMIGSGEEPTITR